MDLYGSEIPEAYRGWLWHAPPQYIFTSGRLVRVGLPVVGSRRVQGCCRVLIVESTRFLLRWCVVGGVRGAVAVSCRSRSSRWEEEKEKRCFLSVDVFFLRCRPSCVSETTAGSPVAGGLLCAMVNRWGNDSLAVWKRFISPPPPRTLLRPVPYLWLLATTVKASLLCHFAPDMKALLTALAGAFNSSAAGLRCDCVHGCVCPPNPNVHTLS